MAKTFLSHMRVGDEALFQYIDTETDEVSFVHDTEKQRVVFTMDSSCHAHYHTLNGEKLLVGNFAYHPLTGKIEFHVDEAVVFVFARDLELTSLVFKTKELIKAEQMFVNLMMKCFSNLFALESPDKQET